MSQQKRPISDVKLSNDEVLEIVTTIVNDNTSSEKDKKQKYEKEHPIFVEAYPTLFEMACKKGFDYKQFQKMMTLKISVDKGTISQHDASVKVGTQLFETYVKNKV
jgi:hypothetical protein